MAQREVDDMAERTVRTYDFDTGVITRIPARELAPGMILAKVEGIEGEVWVSARELEISACASKHPPFCAEVVKMLRAMHKVLKTVYPVSFKAWEKGFRHDAHPEQEIAVWKIIVDGFKHFTDGRNLTREQKQDVFNALLTASNSDKDTVHYVTEPLTLSQPQLKRIANYFMKRCQKTSDIRDFLLWLRQKRNEDMSGEPGTARVCEPIALDALLHGDHHPDSDPRPAFRFADVVLGTGIKTKKNALIFGRKALQVARIGDSEKCLLIFRVKIDEDTDDLEKLCALCQVRKGRHEYDGTCITIGNPSVTGEEQDKLGV